MYIFYVHRKISRYSIFFDVPILQSNKEKSKVVLSEKYVPKHIRKFGRDWH